MEYKKTHIELQATQALPIVKAIAEKNPRVMNAGRPLFVDNKPLTSTSLCYFLTAYRLAPLKFPDLQKGECWHNPAHLTPEEFEIDKGYRPLLQSEINANIATGESKLYTDIHLYNENSQWYESGCTGAARRNTYRTSRPLPPPRVRELTIRQIEEELGYPIKIRGEE